MIIALLLEQHKMIKWLQTKIAIPKQRFLKSFLNMHPVNVPEVIVTFATEKFDSEGICVTIIQKGF